MMHHRVARLSITVEDDSYNERQKFLSSLKTQHEGDSNSMGGSSVGDGQSEHSNEDDSDANQNKAKPQSRTKNRKNRKEVRLQRKLLEEIGESSNTSAIEDIDDSTNDNANSAALLTRNLGRSKRRRSSVALTTIVRKKKFLANHPKLTILSDRPKKATISSIRDLLLYSLTDMDSTPRWCTLANRKSVDKFVIVFLHGLTNEEFGMPVLQNETDPLLISKYNIHPKLNHFQSCFNEVIPMTAPGSKKCIYSTYSSLVSYSLSAKQKAAIQKENKDRKIVLPDLYLTLEEMLFNNYPIHEDVANATQEMIDKTKDFKSTTDFNHGGSKTFALDCEMCRSANGRVLTRVSLTDFDNKVLVDKLIKPTEPIIDYLTQWSGITEEKLIGVETTVEEIQNELLSIISSNDTIVGHSLESDLQVLKIKHPKIVDTSVCFDHPRGPPSKASLKMLMSSHLDTAIQKGFTGHDSVEDCISCMELVKLKISKGYLYGKSYNMESLFKRIAQSNKLIKRTTGEKIPKKSLVIGYSSVKNFGHHESQIQCKSDDEIVDQFIENQEDNDLIVLKLRELEWFKQFSPNHIVENLALPSSADEMYTKINDRLKKIHDSLAPNSILVVCSENGDTREMKRLQQLCKEFKYKVEKNEKNEEVMVEDESWTEEVSKNLATALDQARDALFLCTLKSGAKPELKIEPKPEGQ